MSKPHNPNRPGTTIAASGPDAAVSPASEPTVHFQDVAGSLPPRPHQVDHPLFTYTTVIPIHEGITEDFPSPFKSEPDFTASPPLYYAHSHPVESCMAAHFTKYPHPSVPEILKHEVTEDEVDDATGVRKRTRWITCKNIAPWIFRRMVGGEFVQLKEESTYDPRTREFRLWSENQTYSNLVFAKEASRFKPHPQNPEWTSFVQYGGIRCNPYMGPLKRPLEKFICNRMILGGLQASDLLDDVLNSQSPFE